VRWLLCSLQSLLRQQDLRSPDTVDMHCMPSTS
jgi:hypothetical protein